MHQLLTKKAKGIAIVSDKELEKLRFQHQKLCRLTKQTDSVFALFNLTVFATSIPLLCLFIYTFAFHASDGKCKIHESNQRLIQSLFVVKSLLSITSHVCAKVMFSLCLFVCPKKSVGATTFEALDIETSIFCLVEHLDYTGQA